MGVTRKFYLGISLIIGVNNYVSQAAVDATQLSREAEVKAAYLEIEAILRTGDIEKIKSVLFSKDSQSGSSRVEAMATSAQLDALAVASDQSLNKESLARFKQPFLEAPTPVDSRKLLERAKITVNGDDAVIDWQIALSGGKIIPVHQSLVRVGGSWKLEVREAPISEEMQHQIKLLLLTRARANAAKMEIASEIRAGKYATLGESREALQDKILQANSLAKASLASAVEGKKLLWDLSESHALKDVGWPKDDTSWFWRSDADDLYELTMVLPGHDSFCVLAKSLEVSRAVTANGPATSKYNGDESIGDIQFTIRDPMTAQQVKALLAKLGAGDAIKKQLAAWPPDDPKNQIFNFHQALPGGGGFRADVLNFRKFTGAKDSWSVSLQVDWSSKPPGYWN